MRLIYVLFGDWLYAFDTNVTWSNFFVGEFCREKGVSDKLEFAAALEFQGFTCQLKDSFRIQDFDVKKSLKRSLAVIEVYHV